MSDKAKSRLMIAGAALCAALFLFSGAMLAREYLDQKQSAEAFAEVADLVKEDVEPPTLELADDSAPEPEELTAFEKYADVYAQNSDLVGWITVPGTRIDYPVMQTKDNPNFYLKHAFDQSYSSYGVPYMQENCDIGISDRKFLENIMRLIKHHSTQPIGSNKEFVLKHRFTISCYKFRPLISTLNNEDFGSIIYGTFH